MDVQLWGEEGWLEFREGGGHSLRRAARGQSVFSESQTAHTHKELRLPHTLTQSDEEKSGCVQQHYRVLMLSPRR